MQKQLRIISRSRLSVCAFSAALFPVPSVPPIAFSKHLGRLGVCHQPVAGVRVFHLRSIAWYVWCFPSGRRQLCALPF